MVGLRVLAEFAGDRDPFRYSGMNMIAMTTHTGGPIAPVNCAMNSSISFAVGDGGL